MSKSNLPLSGLALLIWLPSGESPTAPSFDLKTVQTPPSANPEVWWFLGEAIVHAMTVIREHDKQPWIKTGDEFLDPEEIRTIFEKGGNLQAAMENYRRQK